MINFRPGESIKKVFKGRGFTTYVKDTFTNPSNPPQPVSIEEVIEEIKPEENELRRTQVEQETLPSGSESPRKHR